MTALIAATLLFAQGSGTTDDPYLMPPVVITATRLWLTTDVSPWPVEVIYAREEKVTDLSELLARSVTADIRSYGYEGHAAFPILGGVAASRVLVLSNGIHMNSRRDGVIDLSLIPVSPGDRIEIVKGPLSALYGSSAIGGVVNLIPAKDNTLFGSVAVTDQLGITTGANAVWNKGIFGFRGSGSYLKNPGFRLNDDVSRYSGSAAVWVEPNEKRTIELNAGFTSREVGVPGPQPDTTDTAFTPPLFGNSLVTSLYNRQNDRLLTVSLKNTFVPTENYNNIVNIYLINHDFTYHWRSQGISDGIEYFENVADNYNDIRVGGDIQATTYIGELMILTGGLFLEAEILDISHLRTEIETDTVIWERRREQRASHLGVWTEMLAELGAFVPIAALRLEYSDNFGHFLSPELGVSYTPIPQKLKFAAAYGRSFQAPTLNDLFWPADDYSQGNPDLIPERAQSVSLSIEARPFDSFNLNLSGSWKDIKDMITWIPYDGWIWRPENVDRVVIWCGEFNAGLHLWDNLLSGSVGLAYNHAQEIREVIDSVTYDTAWNPDYVTHTVKRQAAFIPPLTAKGNLSIRAWKGGKFSASATWTGIRINYYPDYSPSPDVDVIEKTINPSFKIDFGLQQRLFNLFSIEAGIKNVLNDQTPAHFGWSDDLDYPTAPRRFYGNLSVSYR